MKKKSLLLVLVSLFTMMQGVWAQDLGLDQTSSDNTSKIEENDGKPIMYLDLVRNFTRGDGDEVWWNTICLPFNVDLSNMVGNFGTDVKLAELTGTQIINGQLYFNFDIIDFDKFLESGKEYFIEAGKPYLIQVGKDEDNKSSYMFMDVTITSETHPIETKYADFIPWYDAKALDGGPNQLFLGAYNTLYYPNRGDEWMYGFRAYFQVKGAAQGAKAVVSFDDSITGVKAIESESKQDSNAYDLQGRMVSNPTKGLYIVNGKKVVIK